MLFTTPEVMSERAGGLMRLDVTPILQSNECTSLLGYASRVPASI